MIEITNEYGQKRTPLVYLAGPITNGGTATVEEIKHNAYVAFKVAQRLLDAGISSVMPQLSGLLDNHQELTWQQWMDLDYPMLRRCDAVYRIPGASKGADDEEKYCKAYHIDWFTDLEDCIYDFQQQASIE